jgi:ABC-type glutathione transport system ATPase component
MIQADADVLLIDEVLAVGDAAFQQKCADAFHEMKAMGKTIVLVTHEMSTVETYCHRAMLIDGGTIQHLGDPAEVGRRYMRLNFERAADAASGPVAEESEEVRLLDAWIEGADGARLPNVEHGNEVRLRVELEALRDLPGLSAGFIVANADGVAVFQFGAEIKKDDGSTALAPGERVKVNAQVENLLVAGRYFVHFGLTRTENASAALYVHNAIEFIVFGGKAQTHGVVHLPHQVEIEIEGGGNA